MDSELTPCKTTTATLAPVPVPSASQQSVSVAASKIKVDRAWVASEKSLHTPGTATASLILKSGAAKPCVALPFPLAPSAAHR
jgi:hypothetical protein